ncbi:MAG: glycosyltransferase [Nanoarchaeota archaeon]
MGQQVRMRNARIGRRQNRRTRRLLRVILSFSPEYGGPVAAIKNIEPYLNRHGWYSEILSMDPPDCVEQNSEIRVHAQGHGWSRYGFSLKLWHWLEKNISKYDAVSIHGFWRFCGPATRAACLKHGVPFVVYSHGMLDPWFKHAYPFKHIQKLLAWKLAEHGVVRDASALLFTSEEERKVSAITFEPYRARGHVIPYGTGMPPSSDDDKARQRKSFLDTFPETEGKKLILFLGRIHQKKGCDLLLRAWKKFAKDNYALIMAGSASDDQQEYMSSLRRIASRTEQTVVWTGMLQGDLKWGAFRLADAFILPSHQENFGVAVAEALACGVPCLISDKVNIHDIISANEVGLVQPDTQAGTDELISQWMRCSNARKASMRAKCTDVFMEHFAIEKSAEALVSMLEHTINQKQRLQEQRSRR